MSEIYKGPDRRRFKVLVTRNTEYHMKGDVCVGVRARQREAWDVEHTAVGQQLLGGLGPVNITFTGAVPAVGARLLFTGDVLTSPLVEIERPQAEVTTSYPEFSMAS